MTRKTAHTIMWCLSVLYGVTCGVLAILHGPFVTFAWVGALALGLGWTFTSMFIKSAAGRGTTS
jgi:hypothetical protein